MTEAEREKKQCALDALRAARTLLSKRGAWCQGDLARIGEYGGHHESMRGCDVEAGAPGASFCMIGSLEHVLGVAIGSYPSGWKVHPAIAELQREIEDRTIASFNDEAGRKKYEVIAKFDAAIQRLETELAAP